MKENFSERLKGLRKAIGRTQEDISKVLEIKRSTYGEYERGKIQPPSDKLNRLAEYYGVSVDYLMGKDESILDISKTMTLILSQLDGDSVNFDGVDLDDTTKEMMKYSIENALKIGKMMKGK